MRHPLQHLIDAPLGDAARIYLPAGRRPAIRPKKNEAVQDGIDAPKLSNKELRERKAKQARHRLEEMLAYYATTTVPFERIATHTGLKIDAVRGEMRARRRDA